MGTYIAEYKDRRFFIQSFMLKDCAEMGCKIYKQIEVEITDIDEELENLKQMGLLEEEVEDTNGESN